MEIFSDGGARGNPGPAACAFVVFEDKQVLHKEAKYLGRATNNQAEYNGVLLALNWLVTSSVKYPASGIEFFVDSELVAKQIMGIYRVKDKSLKELYLKVSEILKKIPVTVSFRNIPRTKNKLADFLVNKTLDEIS